jgi:uncharacterized membrane protein YesL
VNYLGFNGVTGTVYTVCNRILKIAYVNILWILFTLAGILVLGIMPATAALFTVVRKWTLKEIDTPIFRTFFDSYKKEFIKSNLIGYFMTVIGLILYLDLKFMFYIGGTAQYIMSIPFFIIAVFYLITLLYLFPVYVHFDLKFFQYFKNALYIGTLNLHITFVMLILLILFCIILLSIPGLLPFFSISVFSIILMWGASLSFRKIDRKQENLSKYH